MIPNFIRKGIHPSASAPNQVESPASKNHPASREIQHTQSLSSVINDPKKKNGPSMHDLMTKSGQFLHTIQGTLDKQLGHIAEAFHIATHENGEFFSPLVPVVAGDFDAYLGSVKEHWSEYKDICSSLIRGKESSTTPSTEIETREGTNAFREIPQVFFNTDYKQSGFEQHQLFTQPIRISVQNQGKMSGALSGYLKVIEQHLVKHLSNVDGLLRSLMTVAEIQSDIAIAHDRSLHAKETLSRVQQGEVKAGLRLVQLARRKARIDELLRVLDLCEQVSQAKPSVESLVRTGDFSAATDLVQATSAILRTKLTNVNCLSEVEVFIEEHGRNIDGKIEAEFADLVSEIVFGGAEGVEAAELRDQKLRSMTGSMDSRDLLISSLQIKLKEVLTKRLKKEMKESSLKIVELFAFMNARLEKLSTSFFPVILVCKSEDTLNIKKLSALRLFEALTVAGLVRISQQMSLEENSFETLKTARFTVLSQLEKTERMYLEVFIPLGLEEHLSFASSVIGSASQNGFSPNVDFTITQMAKKKIELFHQNWTEKITKLFLDEKWDKPSPPDPLITRRLALIDPDVSPSAASDSSPSSSFVGKFYKLNKVNFLLVPAAVGVAEIAMEYIFLALAVPGVALDCLGRIAAIVRVCNSTSKELVLEGGMTVTEKKIINATNLALVSQLVGFLAQLVAACCRKLCVRYHITHHLVHQEEGEEEGGEILLEDASEVLEDCLVNLVMELNEHKMEVFVKLADILVSRFDFHLNSAWNMDGTTAASMDGIVKDFTAMYKVLLKSLQTDNLKRVFSRAFSESASRFAFLVDQQNEALKEAPANRSEFACKLRTDLLYLFQNLLVNEALGGVKSALCGMVADMLQTVEEKFPLIDKSSSAEEAVVKLKSLLRSDPVN